MNRQILLNPRDAVTQMPELICSNCGSKKTGKIRGNYLQWHFKEDPNSILCHKCYRRRYYENNQERELKLSEKWCNINRILRKSYTKRIFRFKDKRITVDHEVRIGVCSKCGKSIKKQEIKRTHLHHEKYDEDNPLNNTKELCVSCHMKRTKELKRFN